LDPQKLLNALNAVFGPLHPPNGDGWPLMARLYAEHPQIHGLLDFLFGFSSPINLSLS